MAFSPKYTITPKILKAISSIEVSRHEVSGLPITASMIVSLRESARLASTHHSTAIEGNRLSPPEVAEVIRGGGHFPNREKDELEVRNYYKALELMETLAKENRPLTERDIKALHGLSFGGRMKPTPYRDGQNVIRSGKLVVYIPPKAEDVPALMADLVKWVEQAVTEGLPIPFVAGLAHYQFATIHPYYDGNGRTARLLATLILHKYGYDLKGIYSLEEYYARNLQAYYNALDVGNDEDYYEGHRATADLTGFLDYFVEGMANSFDKVRQSAENAQRSGDMDQSLLLRNLSPKQRQVIKLFLSSQRISTREIAQFFQVSDRQARHLCKQWVQEGFLEVSNPAPKTRDFQLVEKYEVLVREYLSKSKVSFPES
ncbi:MAG: Fic family protein [Alphaproteobacteria bacterium]|nr:Fic family protein [Alphaproteobacteria bacterium]